MPEKGGGLVPAAGEQVASRGLVRTLLRDERVRYILTGSTGAAIFYSVYAAGWYLSDGRIPYLVLVLLSNLSVALFTFRMYRDGVFRSDTPLVPGFAKFYVMCLSSLVASITVVPLLVEVFGLSEQIAPLVYLVLQPFIYYPIQKFWVFRAKKR